MINKSEIVRLTVKAIPAVTPYLKGRAIAFVWNIDPSYKTEEYFNAHIEHLIQQLYNGYMDGSTFIDIMYSLISGQIYDAYVQAWEDDGNTLPLPDYLDSAEKLAVVNQQDFVQGLADDIIQASVDGKPIDPLLARAGLWSNQWSSEYNNAQVLITANTGGKMMWIEGDTKEKCEQCVALDGIVAYASEWDELNVHPKNAPNEMISCGGWDCECKLQSTDQRRSPKAFETIMNIVSA